MLIVAMGTRTPVFLWLVAMLCDTTIISAAIIANAIHR